MEPRTFPAFKIYKALYDEIKNENVGCRITRKCWFATDGWDSVYILDKDRRRAFFRKQFRSLALSQGPPSRVCFGVAQYLPDGLFRPTKEWKERVDKLVAILIALPKDQCDMLMWKMRAVNCPRLVPWQMRYEHDGPYVIHAAFGW